MSKKKKVPYDAVEVHTYEDLDIFIQGFASGKSHFLVIIGSPGLGKGKTTKLALTELGMKQNRDYMYFSGHGSPFVAYQMAFRFKDRPIVIDDTDTFLNTPAARPFLIQLTESETPRLVSWNTKAKMDEGIPREYWTSSPVCLICNEFHNSNDNMAAIISRASTVVHFLPDPEEVHRRVGTWFPQKGKPETDIYTFLGSKLHLIETHDMRLYDRKGMSLYRTHTNWRDILLSMVCPEKQALAREIKRELLANETYQGKDMKMARIKEFCRQTGYGQAKWYRTPPFEKDDNDDGAAYDVYANGRAVAVPKKPKPKPSRDARAKADADADFLQSIRDIGPKTKHKWPKRR